MLAPLRCARSEPEEGAAAYWFRLAEGYLAAEVTGASLDGLDALSIQIGGILEHGVELAPEITPALSLPGMTLAN